MLDEDTKRQIKNLSPNWWKSIEACSSFLDHFKNYMVTLFISYHLSNKSIQTNFTGFLLYFEDLPLWISAGHVIEDIRNVLQNSDVKIQEMAWLDNHENPKASAVIVSNKELQTYSSFNDGIDFGAIVIGSWEARQIASNNSNLWFTAQAWKNLEKAQPEGYYLVGYPTSYNKTTNMGKVGNKVKKVFEAAVVCLPIEK